jgi:6-phosphogluconolactonase
MPRRSTATRRAIGFALCLLTLVLNLPLQVEAAQSTSVAASGAVSDLFVYVGTYTRNSESRGIYIFRMNLASGVLTPAGIRDGCENPTFLAVHPSQKFLYAIDEVGGFQGKSGGGVSAFAVDRSTGQLTLLNHESSVGNGPCHLVVDKLGQHLLAANYGGGSVVVLPIQEDGRLAPHSCFIQHQGSSVNPRRQEGPHAHSVNLDAANRFAIVADLGLDKLLVYRFDSAAGRLEPNDPPAAVLPPESGPRHFAFHPDGRHAYVINELASSVTAFDYDAERGTFRKLQHISTLPADFTGQNTTAEVQIHPSGRFLYGSNRGHDSIAVFGIDAQTGRLTARETVSTRGKTPRNFALDPTGAYLLAENQGTNTVAVFRINADTGQLTFTGQMLDVPQPVCIKMIPVPAANRQSASP